MILFVSLSSVVIGFMTNKNCILYMLKETIAPLIGVSDNYANGRHDLRIEYTSAVYECGGAPVIIPYNNDKDMLEMAI